MDPSTWKKIETILDQILPLEKSERTRYIEKHVDDAELKREIHALLEAEFHAPQYLDQGVDAFFTGTKAVHNIAENFSQNIFEIDRYRVEKEIGRGGMSVVYLAHRTDGEFDQKVAVKIIQPFGIDREDRFRRLRAERQILANLQHPNIARVFDGGVTPEGWPYMVMELVEGIPITRYCQKNNLNLNARLELFHKICDAVIYAHRNLVVHRDLKPGNILVTKSGEVKLLDFGIAKLIEEDAGASPLTQTGSPLLTPEYAAPEQFRDQTITTSVDVYSLGVILYELLADVRPYDLSQKSITEIEKLVCEKEPERPSGKSTSLKLDSDLDLICLKALRKETENRYSSVQVLKEDIERFQNGLPIQARPTSSGYRIRKFIQRHRQSSAISIAAFFLLAAIIGFYTLQLQKERDSARLEAQKAQRIADFTTGLFTAADPWEELNPESLQVRELLDRGAKKIQEELVSEPEVQASMMQVIATIYKQLGLYDEALVLVEKALETRIALFGKDHPLVAESIFEKGNLLYRLGDYKTSQIHFQEAFDIWNGLGTEYQSSIAAGYNGLAIAFEANGNFEKADSLYSHALYLYESLPVPNAEQTASLLRDWGLMKMVLAENDAADSMLQRSYDIRKKIFGETHPYTAQSLNDIANLSFQQANYDQALEYSQSALEANRSSLGNNHPSTAGVLNRLGVIQRELGNLQESELLHREALSIYRNIFTNPHSNHATTMNYLGLALRKQEKLDEAEAIYREALTIGREIWGDIHPRTAMLIYNIGGILQAKGQYDESEQHYRKVLEIDRTWYGDNHYEVGVDLIKLASLLNEKESYSEAEGLFVEGLEIIKNNLGSEHPRVAEGQANLATLYVETNRYSEAEDLFKNALKIQKATFGSTDSRTIETYRKLAILYETWNKPGKAAEYRRLFAASQ